MEREEAKNLIHTHVGQGIAKAMQVVDKIYDDFDKRTCEHCKFSGYFSPHESLECLNNDCNFYSVDVDLNDGCNKFEPKETL